MTLTLDRFDRTIGYALRSGAANDAINADLTVHAAYRPYVKDEESPQNVARVRSALGSLSANCPRDDYLKVIWSLAGLGWDCAKALAREWCMQAPHRFDEADFRRDWASFDAQRPGGSIGLGTLFSMAKEQGWSESGGSTKEEPRQQTPHPDLIPRLRTWDPSCPPPPKRDFLVEGGFFPLGTCSVLAGLGGSMKTALAILLGMHAASGVAWNGCKLTSGQALIVSGEDDAEEFSRRVGGYAHEGFPQLKHADIARRVHVLPLIGSGVRLTETLYGSPKQTPAVQTLIEAVRHVESNGQGLIRLIVIDHARLFVGGDLNSSEHATAGMDACARIAQETGAAVVLLAHSPKASVTPKKASEYGMGDILGSGAFTDNARFAAVVSTLAEDERKRFGLEGDAAKDLLALRIVKSNYSEAGRVVYMRKHAVPHWGVAYPEPCQLSAPTKPVAITVLDRVVAHIAANPGRYTRKKLRDLGGLKGPLQASERDVRAAVQEAYDTGLVIGKPPTAKETEQYGHRPREEVLHAAA